MTGDNAAVASVKKTEKQKKRRRRGTGALKQATPLDPRTKVAKWRIGISAGYVKKEGRRRQRQVWTTFVGTKQEATDYAAQVYRDRRKGGFIEPDRVKVREWLQKWFDAQVKPVLRELTCATYASAIKRISASWLGDVLLQKLTPTDLERYYAEMQSSASTVALHHTLIKAALDIAVRDKLVGFNVARNRVRRPKRAHASERARAQCWTAEETQRFLAEAAKAGTQAAAFYAVALDTGARKRELHGLRWADVDLQQKEVVLTIERQCLRRDGKTGAPVLRPTKNSRPRRVVLTAATVTLLKAHKVAQAELKLRNRQAYADYGLMFAREAADLTKDGLKLGEPLHVDQLGARVFRRISDAAGCRPIVFHGIRHTLPSLLLGAGVPVRDVADRLGHSKPTMTLNTYAHALPDGQRAAADQLARILAK